jgi:uncharacterized protein (TIGR02284 family)
MNNLDTITMLNRLIVVSKDGESSLRAAAEEAYHPALKASLMSYSRFFGEAASELQHAVSDLGGAPKALGTFGNTLHRTWLHLRSAAQGHNEDVLLDEIADDERVVAESLARAVREETPPKVHDLLERQYEGVLKHYGELREIRERLH